MMNIKGLLHSLNKWLDFAAAAKEIWPDAQDVAMSPEEYNAWLIGNDKPADVQNFWLFAEDKAARINQPPWTVHDPFDHV